MALSGDAVFPTCVGVFLHDVTLVVAELCLPHVRGGVSYVSEYYIKGHRSSPRAWGCFHSSRGGGAPPRVFPTCVGVFLVCVCVSAPPVCLPHVRGGVSHASPSPSRKSASSPRAWGCFQEEHTRSRITKVFPTCVGVFPGTWDAVDFDCCLPHVRGGVSLDIEFILMR